MNHKKSHNRHIYIHAISILIAIVILVKYNYISVHALQSNTEQRVKNLIRAVSINPKHHYNQTAMHAHMGRQTDDHYRREHKNIVLDLLTL